MKDRTIFITAFVVVVLGMIALTFISLGREEPGMMIKDLERSGFDDIKITGTVKSISSHNDITTLIIEQPIEVEARAFDSMTGIAPGDTIIATGELQEFKGKKSLILDSVKKVE